MRLNHVKTTVLVMLTLLAASSCGGSSQSSSGEKPAPAKAPTEQPPAKTSNGPQFTALSAVNTPIYDGPGRTTSLAAKAASIGKPYTVFQFSGVTCESCKADSPAVQAELAKLNVGRVVIFPNQLDEYSESDYKGFIDSYAPGAVRMVDSSMSVLKPVRKSNTQFFGLYIVVRASDSKAFVLNSDTAHLEIVNAVKSIK